MKSKKVGKFGSKNHLIRLQMVQFECPRIVRPFLSVICITFQVKKRRDKESSQAFVEDADYDTYLLQGENELK